MGSSPRTMTRVTFSSTKLRLLLRDFVLLPRTNVWSLTLKPTTVEGGRQWMLRDLMVLM
ncbi:hypothetical protein ACHAWF_014688 [Thalassiosira exigua]